MWCHSRGCGSVIQRVSLYSWDLEINCHWSWPHFLWFILEFKAVGTKLRMSSSYYPESDGQIKVMNRYLHCFAAEHPRRLAYWSSWAEYNFNTSFHTATGRTPFEVVYGRSPRSHLDFLPEEVKAKAVVDDLVARDEILWELIQHLERAQQQMKHQANQRRRDIEFQVGDKVFLKFRPYQQFTLSRKLNAKLAPKFFGPFEIVQWIGKVVHKFCSSCRFTSAPSISRITAQDGSRKSCSGVYCAWGSIRGITWVCAGSSLAMYGGETIA